MSLSVVISGAIVLFTLFVALSSFPVIAESTFGVSQGSVERSQIENQFIHTNLEIQSLSANPNSQNITINLENTGLVKLWDYEKFDIIVTYDAKITGKKVRTTEVLTYIEQCPTSNGEWCIDSITNDNIDPDILNTNEIAVIEADLDYQVHPTNGIVIVSITADNGVSITNSVEV